MSPRKLKTKKLPIKSQNYEEEDTKSLTDSKSKTNTKLMKFVKSKCQEKEFKGNKIGNRNNNNNEKDNGNEPKYEKSIKKIKRFHTENNCNVKRVRSEGNLTNSQPNLTKSKGKCVISKPKSKTSYTNLKCNSKRSVVTSPKKSKISACIGIKHTKPKDTTDKLNLDLKLVKPTKVTVDKLQSARKVTSEGNLPKSSPTITKFKEKLSVVKPKRIRKLETFSTKTVNLLPKSNKSTALKIRHNKSGPVGVHAHLNSYTFRPAKDIVTKLNAAGNKNSKKDNSEGNLRISNPSSPKKGLYTKSKPKIISCHASLKSFTNAFKKREKSTSALKSPDIKSKALTKPFKKRSNIFKPTKNVEQTVNTVHKATSNKSKIEEYQNRSNSNPQIKKSKQNCNRSPPTRILSNSNFKFSTTPCQKITNSLTKTKTSIDQRSTKLLTSKSLTKAPIAPVSQDSHTFQLHSKPNFLYNQGVVEKLCSVSNETQWADKIHLALSNSASSNPRENEALRNILLKASNENVPWPTLEKILQDCGVAQKISRNCFLVQLRYQCKIDIICCVRTTNIGDLKKTLLSLLTEYKASFQSVIDQFKHNSFVEALASYRTSRNFVEFEQQLSKNAMDCKAKGVEIIDYQSGFVHFNCHPLQLADVVQELDSKGYRVLYTDYGLSLGKKVQLPEAEMKLYVEFLCKLRSFKEIENIFDNLRIVNVEGEV